MRYWWVNHKQTRTQEVGGGYIWAPHRNRDGTHNPTYESLTRVRPGDLVLSYASQRIGAIGCALSTATQAPKPTDFDASSVWANDGWLVPVRFESLRNPLVPQQSLATIVPLLPKRYAPLRADGKGQQKFYLVELAEPLAQELLRLIRMADGPDRLIDVQHEAQAVEAERKVCDDPALRETERLQLVLSRRGQGTYRERLMQLERACRITGTSNPAHLRASHIKPWRVAENHERLDGNNGLLFAPHVDHLFDRGFIGFEDDGRLLVSSILDPQILKGWGLERVAHTEPFREAQRPFLSYHRAHVLRGAAMAGDRPGPPAGNG